MIFKDKQPGGPNWKTEPWKSGGNQLQKKFGTQSDEAEILRIFLSI